MEAVGWRWGAAGFPVLGCEKCSERGGRERPEKQVVWAIQSLVDQRWSK